MRRYGRGSLAGAAVLAMLLAGCTSTAPAPVPTPAPASGSTQPVVPGSGSAPPELTPSAAPTESVKPAGGKIDHVVIIVLENKSASQILAAAESPYFNRLAGESAVAANYQAIRRPSLPNYIAMTAGTTAGITSNCKPKDCTRDVRNIADSIADSGRTWKMYAEGMRQPCLAENSGDYAVKHNPFMYYRSVTADKAACARQVVPYSSLEQDLATASGLPDYAFISPDMCNGTHDCPIRTGDDWLSREVPKILGSPAFTDSNSLLVITWDEGGKQDNRVATLFAGPAARNGHTSEAAYTHYSLLHTIEDAWGLPPLTENDRNAPIMSDMLK